MIIFEFTYSNLSHWSENGRGIDYFEISEPSLVISSGVSHLLPNLREVPLSCVSLVTRAASAFSSATVATVATVSSPPVKADTRGMERTLARCVVKRISHSRPDWKIAQVATHLLVNNSNALFALSSMSWGLAAGSSNLSRQLLANASATSPRSIDLRPPTWVFQTFFLFFAICA